MNKKGFVLVNIMIAMLIFTSIAALIPSIREQVITSRSDLNCSSDALTAAEEGTCIVNDGYLFFFVATGFAVALGWIGTKVKGFGGS